MKFTKLSLIAAVAASTAFAGGDIAPVEPAPVVEAVSPWTFGGDAKLYYKTNSSVAGASIFDQAAAQGQGAISADIGYAINSNWKVNMGLTGLVTLGLDDSVVSGVWLYAGADAANTGAAFPGNSTSVGDALWIDTLNITGTMFDGALTTVIGRQMLDTPLAFSETWSIAPNTFDAAVALVKPVENVTLVAGYIYDGNGNGRRITTFDGDNSFVAGAYTGQMSAGGFTGDSGYFPIAGINKGAWTVAGIATFAGITGQAWYYDVMDVAQAVWVQADGEFSGFTVGAQYAWITADDTLNNIVRNGHGVSIDDSSAWAAKIGYKMDALSAWVAYSSVDDKGVIDVSNTATMLGQPNGMWWGNPSRHAGQTKLYTEAWWNYGYVGNPGADTLTAAASYDIGSVSIFENINLMAQYTNIQGAKNTINYALSLDSTGNNPTTALTETDLDEVTVVLGTDVAGLNVQVAYINTQMDTKDVAANTTASDTTDEVQLYLTYKF